jgi:hypothetical protein
MNKIDLVTDFCKANLDLINIEAPEEYGYSCLPLCVIDAIFSIGVNYKATENTVQRFCSFYQINRKREFDAVEPMSISTFILINAEHTPEWMARNVYKNLQRTSTRNGILKADAVGWFAEVLLKLGVNNFADIDKILGNKLFETAITAIPGQKSGVSLKYFFMLAGIDTYIKPDRMVKRFLQNIIGKVPDDDECLYLISGAVEILLKDYPNLSPRTLDNLIWKYQRQ